MVSVAQAQESEHEKKLSPVLALRLSKTGILEKIRLRVTVSGKDIPDELNKANYETRKIAGNDNYTFIAINCTKEDLFSRLLKLPQVIFVEDALRVPEEEIQVSNLDLSANKINLTHRFYPQWNGDGLTVSVKENKPDTSDIDFKGRFLTTHLSSTIVSGHASIMSTMIAGGGNSWHLGKGAEWGSTISSSDFASLLPDPNAAYQQYNISVQNHSYGVGVESYYGSDAAAYDASVVNNPSLLHIFSSGNSGTASATTGTYANITGFANLSGSFKMAKNIITVGATDSFGVVAALSSKGPAHDGRVKPELVAFGVDGTSGAAALVSGTALMLQHFYKQQNGSLPSNTLIKAVLINSADDVGNAEVDYSAGFGSLNAYNAMKTLQSGRYMNGSVVNGGSQAFNISVPAGIKKLKVSLVWNDLPANPNAPKALINDLDLELLYPSSSQSWQPWVLNTFPYQDSLLLPATRKRDSLNNIEQITLDNPAPGNYQFKVSGFDVTTASQSFFIAYHLDSTDIFEWHFPTANDFVFSSASNTIRWNSSFASSTGKLEFSSDGGNIWQTVENSLDLTSKYYGWNVPSITTTALLRMTIGSDQFVSDTFTISQRTLTGVGFNCPDSFLIYWSKIPMVTDYRIYQLGSKYIEPFFTTTDSFAVFSKNINPSLHYAAAPIIGNREGMKSYTFNYTTQGVGCYIRSFLAFLNTNSVLLSLELGTLYQVQRISWEKLSSNDYQTIQTITSFSGLQYSYTDMNPTQGVNTYRVKIELANGKVVYSTPETIYYTGEIDYIIYPNPATQYQTVHVLSKDVNDATLQIFDAMGAKVYETILDDQNKALPAGKFSKGIYFIRIIDNDKNQALKLVIY